MNAQVLTRDQETTHLVGFDGGDIALKHGEPSVHAHVVVGRRDGSAHGGHLLEARVRPTLELVLVESPAHLRKEHDSETGLALIAPRS